MAEDKNIQTDNAGNGEPPASREDRFESDTQKIVRKHLEDPDHVITEEEMQQIRVGMTPPEAQKTAVERMEDESKIEEAEKKIIGDPDNVEDSNNDRDNRFTPWDTIDP